MLLADGSLLAGYRIDGTLGQGGMGVVYEACQLALDRVVALKVLSPELSGDESFRERFRREGLIQARIDHPNIVPVYEAGEHDGALFLSMRLVRGSNLKQLISGRELEAARTLRLLVPVADALDAAHESGLIHRDVKPQNILVGARDHAFLADFGLTKAPTEQRSLTRTGQFVGTLDYVSPEQIRGEEATARSDVYSIAAVLYECLTGVVPFPRQSDVAVLFAHMSDAPPLVTDRRPDLPADLDAVLVRAMAKDPQARQATATDLLREAERAFGHRIRAAITPPPSPEVPEEAGIRRAEEDVTTIESRVRHTTGQETTAAARAAPPLRGASPPPAEPAPPPLGHDAASGRTQPPAVIGAAGPLVATAPAPGGGAASGAPVRVASGASGAAAPRRRARRGRAVLLVAAIAAALAGGVVAAGRLGGNDAADRRLRAEAIARAEADARREARAAQRAGDAAAETRRLRREVDALKRRKANETARRARDSGASPPAPAQRRTSCGPGLSVNSATSCAFARNVRDAYEASGGASVVDVYSPVTKRAYTMRCTGGVPTVCTGGSNAAVHIR